MNSHIVMDAERVQRAQKIFEKSGVDFAGVFGSRARGDATHVSDIDILVRFKKPVSLSQFSRLRRNLSESLRAPVDIVTEGSLSPYLRETILRELQTIYGAR